MLCNPMDLVELELCDGCPRWIIGERARNHRVILSTTLIICRVEEDPCGLAAGAAWLGFNINVPTDRRNAVAFGVLIARHAWAGDEDCSATSAHGLNVEVGPNCGDCPAAVVSFCNGAWPSVLSHLYRGLG